MNSLKGFRDKGSKAQTGIATKSWRELSIHTYIKVFIIGPFFTSSFTARLEALYIAGRAIQAGRMAF